MALAPNTDVYKHIVSRNQLRLKEFCEDCIDLLKDNKNHLNINMIKALHNICMSLLLDETGKFRTSDCHISYSDHIPPPSEKIFDLLFNCLHEIKNNWDNEENEFYLAAYALWRLNWIHPFEDGNGIVSRALCYIILTARYGRSNSLKILPELIELNEDEYRTILRTTDNNYGETDGYDDKKLSTFAFYLINIYLEDYYDAQETHDHDL